MRTVGTLTDVVISAAGYYNGTETGRPHNPVVRRRECDKKWMLESGLGDGSDSDIEISLDDFDAYFYEMYGDDIEITESVENDFVKMLENSKS
jgi:hypothetical protein